MFILFAVMHLKTVLLDFVFIVPVIFVSTNLFSDPIYRMFFFFFTILHISFNLTHERG